MQMALQMAKRAQKLGEVPVGCVMIDKQGQILARTHNKVIQNHNPTAHAECLAIKQACHKLQQIKLHGARLFVTLEPCPMCAGAMVHSQLGELIFGAYSPKTGAVDHGICLFDQPQTTHRPAVIGGVMQDECAQILQDFFQKLR